MADEFSKYQDFLSGPGGKKCRCCNKYRGKCRARLNRLARRKFKKALEKDLKND